MKIFDKEFELLGQELRIRIVPKKFRTDLGHVGILLLDGKVLEAEGLLDKMRENYCRDYCQDDIDMMYYRDQVRDIKCELMV